MKSLETDFGDVLSVSSIGKTTEGRDIQMITLDATGTSIGESSKKQKLAETSTMSFSEENV